MVPPLVFCSDYKNREEDISVKAMSPGACIAFGKVQGLALQQSPQIPEFEGGLYLGC